MPVTKNSIEFVVEDELCLRCGACVPICPVPECITLDTDLLPRVNPDTCIECGVCQDVCPGAEFDLDALKAKLPHPPHTLTMLGGIFQPSLARAVSPETRLAGASGGFVSQLLARLLETGEIDGAVVATADPTSPGLVKPIVARTPEEALRAAGSKYTAVPMASVMDEIIGKGTDRYAFVGVSCHVHSLRLMIRARPHLARKIRYVIGLFCRAAFEPRAAHDLLAAAGVEADEVTELRYRDGPWPGVIQAVTANDVVPLHYSNYKDGAYNYLQYLYTQSRCWQCFDFSNELCDLAVGDPWGRDARKRYEYSEGYSLVLTRTAAGLELMETAAADSSIEIREVPAEYVENSVGNYSRKRAVTVSARIRRMQRKRLPVARYDRKLPTAGRKDIWLDRLYAAASGLGRNSRARYRLLRFLLSKWALPLVWARQLKKYGIRGFRYHQRLVRRKGDHPPGV